MVKVALLLLVVGPLFIQCASLEPAKELDEMTAKQRDAGLDSAHGDEPRSSIGRWKRRELKCYVSKKPIGQNPNPDDFYIQDWFFTADKKCGMTADFRLDGIPESKCNDGGVKRCCDGFLCNDPRGNMVQLIWIDYMAKRVAHYVKQSE